MNSKNFDGPFSEEEFGARPGARISNAQARIVARTCHALQIEKKPIEPKELVRVAKDPKHPTHDLYEWDDAKAANEHRLWRARNLLNAIVRVVKIAGPSGETTVNVRAYPHLRTREENEETGTGYRPGGYYELGNVVRDVDMSRELLEESYRELEYWQVRYEHLKALLKSERVNIAFASIEKALVYLNPETKEEELPAPKAAKQNGARDGRAVARIGRAATSSTRNDNRARAKGPVKVRKGMRNGAQRSAHR